MCAHRDRHTEQSRSSWLLETLRACWPVFSQLVRELPFSHRPSGRPRSPQLTNCSFCGPTCVFSCVFSELLRPIAGQCVNMNKSGRKEKHKNPSRIRKAPAKPIRKPTTKESICNDRFRARIYVLFAFHIDLQSYQSVIAL